MATKLTRDQQRELARIKFVHEGKTFLEISAEVGVSRQSISRWAKEDRWEDLRLSISMTQAERLKSTYRQLSELDKLIESRPEGERYPSTKEADARKKLTASIRDLQTEIGVQEIISSFNEFLGWLRNIDGEEARRIAPILDNFVKSKI